MARAFRIFAAVIALISFGWSQAHAQIPLTGAGRGAPAPSYTGPGDIAPGALAWWGLRAYSAAKAGTKSVKLIRSSDSTLADISTLANGHLNTSDPFFNGSTYKVDTWYDQTGNGFDLLQATDANRPTFTLSGLNGLPIVQTTASLAMRSATSGLANQNQPASISGVIKRPSSDGINSGILSNAAFVSKIGFSSSANIITMYGNSTAFNAPANDGVFHAVQAFFNGGSSSIMIDGSSTPGAVSATNPFWGDSFALNPGFDSPATAHLTEWGFWASDKSANFSAINTNQTNYWGPF